MKKARKDELVVGATHLLQREKDLTNNAGGASRLFPLILCIF